MNITLKRRWNISDAVTKRLKPVFFYKLLYEATLLNVMVTIQSQSQKTFGFLRCLAVYDSLGSEQLHIMYHVKKISKQTYTNKMFHIRVFKRVQDNEESVSENRINQFF
jgi:hypothetical protein